MADQLRRDFVGPYTPNINALINDSVQFSNAYCNSPLCVPARATFFTSTHPGNSGCLINPWEESDHKHGYIKAGIPSLYTILEDEWDSWHSGKQHLFTEDHFHEKPESKTKWLPLDGGKERREYLEKNNIKSPGGSAYKAYLPEIMNQKTTKVKAYSIPTTGLYPNNVKDFYDGFITSDSLTAIRERDKSKPFMLNAMFLAPHPPLQIPNPYYDKYQEAPLSDNVGKWYSAQSPLQMYQLTGFIGSRYSREDWKEIWRVYAGLVNLLDDCVGQIIDELKKENMYDDSIIIFTSDHGEMLGSHGLWQKMCLYEESAAIPLSFKLPNNEFAGKKIDRFVSHIDVLPTILDLLKVEKNEHIQGQSLVPLFNDKTIEDKPVFIQHDGNGALGTHQRCIIKDGYKLIVDTHFDEKFFELYDLNNDPLETKNESMLKTDVTKELLNTLINHMKENQDLLTFEINDFEEFLINRTDLINKPQSEMLM